MAIHLVAQIAGVEFQVTLSRDEAGNYVAEGARARTDAPRVRVVDGAKERALSGLYDSLTRLVAGDGDGTRTPARGPVAGSHASPRDLRD